MQCGSKGPELTRFFADATAWIDGCLVKQAARPFAAVTLSFTTVAVKLARELHSWLGADDDES